MIRRLMVALVVLVILAALSFNELKQRWDAPLVIPEQGFTLTVVPGDSLRAVVDRLQSAGVLLYPRLVMLYGRLTGLDQELKHGEYLLPQKSTAASMLQQLRSGSVVQYQVTLPEGITLDKALDILSNEEKLESTLEGSGDPRIADLIKPQTHPEGLFLPDTYQFTRGDTDWSIVQRAHQAMLRTLQEEWHQRAEQLPFETPYEALIMASIIERETGLPQERELIAGVFTRRLQKAMLLQTDPTVIYGLGENFDGNLQREHLNEIENSYNTYRHPGLPPTPIALPGRAAIHAALHPDSSDALYFVARGDGGHAFSATLNEHNQAVRKYQLQRPNNYRSTPSGQQ
jgi:UPF0755 protein